MIRDVHDLITPAMLAARSLVFVMGFFVVIDGLKLLAVEQPEPPLNHRHIAVTQLMIAVPITMALGYLILTNQAALLPSTDGAVISRRVTFLVVWSAIALGFTANCAFRAQRPAMVWMLAIAAMIVATVLATAQLDMPR